MADAQNQQPADTDKYSTMYQDIPGASRSAELEAARDWILRVCRSLEQHPELDMSHHVMTNCESLPMSLGKPRLAGLRRHITMRFPIDERIVKEVVEAIDVALSVYRRLGGLPGPADEDQLSEGDILGDNYLLIKILFAAWIIWFLYGR